MQVKLSSSDAAVQVPPVITVPQGEIEFDNIPITTTMVRSAIQVQVTASTSASSRQAVLRVLPKSNCPLKSVTVAPGWVQAGDRANGRVKLCETATEDKVIILSTSDTSLTAAGAPDSSLLEIEGPTVTVHKGEDSAGFLVKTYKNGVATITATLDSISESAQLTINPIRLRTIQVNNHDPDQGTVPEVLCGQSDAIGHVILNHPAPDAGITVYLRIFLFKGTGDTHVTIPPTVAIGPNHTDAYFDIGTSAPDHLITAILEASLSSDFGTVVFAELQIHPLGVISVTLNPNNHACGGEALTATVTLCGSAPEGGAQLFVQSDNPAAAWVESPQIQVPAHASSMTFNVHTAPVTKEADVQISVGSRIDKRSRLKDFESADLVIDPTSATLAFDQNPVVGGNDVTVTVTLCGPAGPNGVSGSVVASGPPYLDADGFLKPLIFSKPDCDFHIPSGQTQTTCHIRTLVIAPVWMGLKTGANVGEVYLSMLSSESLSSLYHLTVIPGGITATTLRSVAPPMTREPAALAASLESAPRLSTSTNPAMGMRVASDAHLASADSGTGALPAQSPWSRFHADALNSGRGIGSGAPAQQKWVFSTGSAVISSPAIGPDSTVYVGSADGDVYALDGASGAKKSSFNTGGGVVSSPAIATDGTIYIGSGDNNLYALDGVTGEERWRFGAGGPISSSPAIGLDGTVCVGSDDGDLYAIDGTGQQKWIFYTAGPIVGAPALGTNGTIYFGSGDSKLYALDAAPGTKRWAFAAGDAVNSSPAIGADGTVYVGSSDGSVYALDGASGQQKWSYQTAGPVLSSPAIGADGTIYIGSDDGLLYAIDPATGQKRWSSSTGNAIDSSVAIAADGTIYVGSPDLNLYAIDSANGGVEKWVLPLGDRIVSSPAIGADGTVYVGGESGNIYAVGSVPAGPPIFTAEPEDQTVIAGNNVTFTVKANGAMPLNYQWQKGMTNLVGATNASFSLTNVSISDAGNYDVLVSNSDGSVTSAGATLTVTPAPALWFDKTTLRKLAGGDFSVALKVGAGKSFEVDSSTDLTHWETLAIITNTATGSFLITDPRTTLPRSFYRAQIK
ncbi:MAG: outer membrane protein assembly factor BamB family protein [Limisphaerales bacterium]